MLLFEINFNMRQHHYKRLRRAGARRGLVFFCAIASILSLFFSAPGTFQSAPIKART